MINPTNGGYSLGPNGKYGTATCMKAENIVFNDVKIGGNHLGTQPTKFAPFIKVVKNLEAKCYELQIVFFAPIGFELDVKNPIVCDYMGAELMIFVNLEQDQTNPTELQCYIINACFTNEFSVKLKGKKIFVIPVHGDPEEGEVVKVVVEDEGEID
ncbi:MAG: hypothetical protein ACI9Z3_000737 [Roseivirga sp.]|jgi:hypothetical protein